MTRRRYNTIFDHAHEYLPWAERTPVSAHVTRSVRPSWRRSPRQIAGFVLLCGEFGTAVMCALRRGWSYIRSHASK